MASPILGSRFGWRIPGNFLFVEEGAKFRRRYCLTNEDLAHLTVVIEQGSDELRFDEASGFPVGACRREHHPAFVVVEGFECRSEPGRKGQRPLGNNHPDDGTVGRYDRSPRVPGVNGTINNEVFDRDFGIRGRSS
jgi:hypothetical protein